MSTLTRTEWQDCAWAARFHRDRLYEFRMWDKGYLCGVELHTAPGDPARARAEATAAKTEADLREWRALAREFQAEASR